MSLHGIYRLRIVSVEHPNPGVGGMYLTLTPDKQVTIEAMGPENFEAQRWLIQPVEGGTHIYKIEKPAVFGEPPEGLREERVRGKDIIVFGPDPEEWKIIHMEGDVYLISPNKNIPIGVEHLVGTDETQVVVKTFPVIPGDRPAWKFAIVD